MTAMWASPVATRSCSPVADRSTRADGSSSSIRWSAAPILSRSAFVWGSIATVRVGTGKSSGGRMIGASFDDSVSPVSVDGQLRDGADLARLVSSPIGSWSLPWSSSSWPIRSSSSRFAFQAWAWPWSVPERTRRYVSRPTNGSAAVLNDAGDELARRIRVDRRVGAGLRVLRRDRGLLGGGRHVADERVEQGVDPDALRGAADEDRGEDRVADAAVEAGVELLVADLLALEVLRQDVVVGLGGGLEELVAALRDLVGEAVGDRDLDLRPAVEPIRLAVDEVDVALERLARADRDVERRDLVAEPAPERVERRRRVRVLLVALVDEEARRPAGRAAQRDARLEPGLDRPRRVGDEQRAVGRGEAADDLGDEVRVAGRVDERDPGPVVLERGDRQAERLLALLLLGLVVEVGACRRRPCRAAGSRRPGTGDARRAWSCHRRRDPPGRRF